MLRSHGHLTLADCEIVVRRTTGLQYPLRIRSFWDEVAQKWVPWDLVVGYTCGGLSWISDF